MKVSVVVPAYNEERYIEACLQSLLKQTEKPDEIIVVDNNSTDKTAAIAKQYGVVVVKEKKQGMIPARNKGFNITQYEIIARTDADTRVPREWIGQIKKAFKKDAQLLAYSGPATWYKIPKAVQPFNWQTRIWFEPFKIAFGHDSLLGPNMALRRSVWEKVAHDVCTQDKIVHEDMDLAYHIGKIGKIKFDPKHVVSMSPRRFKKAYSYLEYGFRDLRTIQHHKQSLHALKKHGKRLEKAIAEHKLALQQLKKKAFTSKYLQKYL